MKFEEHQVDMRGSRKYVLDLDDSELMPLNLDKFDRMLIRECGASNSIADKLLALECIVRKIEQSHGIFEESQKLQPTAEGSN